MDDAELLEDELIKVIEGVLKRYGLSAEVIYQALKNVATDVYLRAFVKEVKDV